jgi:hypothetical protein
MRRPWPTRGWCATGKKSLQYLHVYRKTTTVMVHTSISAFFLQTRHMIMERSSRSNWRKCLNTESRSCSVEVSWRDDALALRSKRWKKHFFPRNWNNSNTYSMMLLLPTKTIMWKHKTSLRTGVVQLNWIPLCTSIQKNMQQPVSCPIKEIKQHEIKYLID